MLMALPNDIYNFKVETYLSLITTHYKTIDNLKNDKNFEVKFRQYRLLEQSKSKLNKIYIKLFGTI